VSRPPVIIPCAGLGTRLLPATVALSKELLPLGRYPALLCTLLEADAAGLSEVVVVTAPGKEDLRRLLDPDLRAAWPDSPALLPLRQLLSRLRITLAVQPAPDGVLDAIERGILTALGHAAGPAAVLFPDLIHLPDQRALVQLLRAHEACRGTVYGLYVCGETPPLHGPSTRVITEGEPQPGRPCRILRVEPGGGPPRPGEVRTTFGTLHTPAFSAALDRAARSPAGPLDDRRLLAALNLLAAAGELYGVVLTGEILDLGILPGYLDAARRFAGGEAGLRGM
jgi:UTP-glucose-1-phosphate uridylyltransferase